MITEGTEIDATRAKYSTCHKAIRKAGLVPVVKENSPPLVWVDGILSISDAESLLPYQRVNKIPCMDFLCYKSTLFDELNQMKKSFPAYFEFYPHTYLLPNDFPEFQREHSFICGRTATAPVWVIKPKNGCCGKGIHFIQSIQEAEVINYPSVAQLLVNPFRINEKKFDFRFFLLIASLEPFSAFIYEEGIARFCTEKYVAPSKSNLDHPYAQLTNTAINKHNGEDPENFTKPASHVLKEVIAAKPSAINIWEEIKTVSLLTLAGIFPSIVATLPMSGGATIRAKLVDSLPPSITVPNSIPTFLKPSKNFPFLGAQHHSKKSIKKKNKRAKSTRKQKTKKVLPDIPNPSLQNPTIFNSNNSNSHENEINQEKSDDTVINPKERFLNDAQHYSHILGIDIILDSRGHPKVLELNDRPSLMVTAPFEQELKENLLSESFTHISLDGGFFGNNEKSRWQQLFPLPPTSELSGPINAMLQHNSNLKYTGRMGVNSPGTQRMMVAGIKNEVHNIRRNRILGSQNLVPSSQNISNSISNSNSPNPLLTNNISLPPIDDDM